MAQIWEYIKIALMNIKSNKGRSVLTMLGIIIGIASVIMVMAIGNGVRNQINEELESMGSGLIELYLDTTLEDVTMRFSEDDFDLIMNNVDHVKGVTPVQGGWGNADGPKGNFEARAMGGTESLQYYSANGGPVIKGKYFTKEDVESGNRVCVITENSAILMFGTTDVISMSFELTLYGISQEVTIIGIREDSASMLMGTSSRVDMEVPLSMLSNDFYFYAEEFSDIRRIDGLLCRSGEKCNKPIGKQIQYKGRRTDSGTEHGGHVSPVRQHPGGYYHICILCGGNFALSWRYRRYEYHACICNGKDEGNRYP